MGLIHKREYEDILAEFAAALLTIDSFYDFFEMDSDDWNSLSSAQQLELAETLGDDLFFALDTTPCIKVGKGIVEYMADQNLIKLSKDEKLVKQIKLT